MGRVRVLLRFLFHLILYIVPNTLFAIIAMEKTTLKVDRLHMVRKRKHLTPDLWFVVPSSSHPYGPMC